MEGSAMLKDDVMKLLNMVFERAKIPVKITELFLYRPAYHEPPFENFEPINEAKRLISCDPLFIEITFNHDNRLYEYQLRCSNNRGSFLPGFYWLKKCDIYPNEDPKNVEKGMEDNIKFISGMLLKTLELLSKE